MPSTSPAQHHMMLAVAHDPAFARKVGIPQSVGRDFAQADKGRSFAAGGEAGAAGLRLAHLEARRHAVVARAGGGYTPPSPTFGEREAYREQIHPGGPILSDVPGRTDHLPMSVAADSYVIPADVMSGLGEGNTLAGAKVVDSWMNSGPWGTHMPVGRAHVSASPMLHLPLAASPHFAAGGTAARQGHVKIAAAGGEYVVPPFVIAHHPDLGGLRVGDRNPKNYHKAVNFGHKVLDAFVLHQRAKTIKEMTALPGPKKD